MSFLYWGGQTGHSMCECWVEGDKNFLWFPGSAPADAVPDAAGRLSCQGLLLAPAQLAAPRAHSPELPPTHSIPSLILFQSFVSSDLNNQKIPNPPLTLKKKPQKHTKKK